MWVDELDEETNAEVLTNVSISMYEPNDGTYNAKIVEETNRTIIFN